MESGKIKGQTLVQGIIASLNDSDSSDGSIFEANVVKFNEEEYELPNTNTEFRRNNANLLLEGDAKYRGKTIARKDFRKYDILREKVNTTVNCSGTEFSSNNVTTAPVREKRQGNDGHIWKKKCAKEVGLSVLHQVKIWEQLLEARIQSQKILINSNKLSLSSELSQNISAELEDASRQCVDKTTMLLKSLLELQTALYNQNTEVKNCMVAKTSSDYNTKSLTPEKRWAVGLDNFQKFRPYRDSVLEKWDERTRMLTATSHTPSCKLKGNHESIGQRIKNALVSRKTLIEKYQTARTNDSDSGGKTTQFSNSNIYDDSEFYHQLLREFIEYRTNTSFKRLETAKHYAELHQLRQQMKIVVDTRASKGRKLRYAVHHKLVNFKAPHETTEETKKSREELYKSIFAT